MRREGLSRSEFLVATLMVAVISALVLSFISRARETSARMVCQMNLRQLTLGAMNYHATMPRLPPLTDTETGLMSVFAQLAPYLSADAFGYSPGLTPPEAYHAASSHPFSFQTKEGGEIVRYGGAANQVGGVFLDPADPTAQGLRDIQVTLPDGTTGHYATGSYSANGLLAWGQKTGVKSLEDWPGPVILIAERPQVCHAADGETVHNLWGIGFYSPSMPTFAALTPAIPSGLRSTGQAAPAGSSLYRFGRADADPRSADFPTPIPFVRSGQPCDPRLPGTPHRAGMQVAMSDWSVRAFALNTDPEVFWSACVGSSPAP